MPLTAISAGLFGENLVTSHGEQWQRQRRLVAPNFNEGISSLVWKESCSQATEMLEYFLEGQNGETDETISGLRQIAIHILAEAGYGIHESWRTAMIKSKQPRNTDSMTYIEAVHAVINNLLEAAIFPAWLFTLPIMPQWFQTIGMGNFGLEP